MMHKIQIHDYHCKNWYKKIVADIFEYSYKIITKK